MYALLHSIGIDTQAEAGSTGNVRTASRFVPSEKGAHIGREAASSLTKQFQVSMERGQIYFSTLNLAGEAGLE